MALSLKFVPAHSPVMYISTLFYRIDGVKAKIVRGKISRFQKRLDRRKYKILELARLFPRSSRVSFTNCPRALLVPKGVRESKLW